MVVRKYVLIVDGVEGAVMRGANELVSMGYDVARVDSLAQALSVVGRLERLSMIAVNCESNQVELDHPSATSTRCWDFPARG